MRQGVGEMEGGRMARERLERLCDSLLSDVLRAIEKGGRLYQSTWVSAMRLVMGLKQFHMDSEEERWGTERGTRVRRAEVDEIDDGDPDDDGERYQLITVTTR
eukprot:3632445-Pyramimonas_sp.AAC.1